MKTTHYLTRVAEGTRHTVQFDVVDSVCTISSETWDTEDGGGMIRNTPETNWSRKTGRRFYARYMRRGYVA